MSSNETHERHGNGSHKEDAKTNAAGRPLQPHPPAIPTAATAMSTSALEAKLRQLQKASQEHSQVLTQKLASSQSGQNLLHIGTSLSTLPPDLHNLLTQLHPVCSHVEGSERTLLAELQSVVERATAVRAAGRRVQTAADAANLYADLVAAEGSIQRQALAHHSLHNLLEDSVDEAEEEEEEEDALDELDQAASLERAAHISLCLVEELSAANQHLSLLTTNKRAGAPSGTENASHDAGGGTPSTTTLLPSLSTRLEAAEEDTEKAQFLMKLAPRIRRLESDTVQCLVQRMEALLQKLQQKHHQNTSNGSTQQEDQDGASNSVDGPVISNGEHHGTMDTESGSTTLDANSNEDVLLMLGHCMRGLALLGRGTQVESIFARIAIMPLIRSQISMGRLDQGGARGECAGLPSLLQEVADSIQQTYGPVLWLAQDMFDVVHNDNGQTATSQMDVDLLTAGVWVPIVTALMADAAIKMAIFSPGIASILQANYLALDAFLSQLAERLLKRQEPVSDSKATEEDSNLFYLPTMSEERIQRAQDRIYAHPKTAEFSKRWNLPIYYQLRFGECCARLNRAVDQTAREGWIANVFSGDDGAADQIRQQIGFELDLFLELYDILLGLWRPDVILRPLTNRFLRGAVQLVGRVISFISDSMEGKIMFGQEEEPFPSSNGSATTSENGGDETQSSLVTPDAPRPSARRPYCWGESEEDVAAVAWELTILESAMRHDYVDTVSEALAEAGSDSSEQTEVRGLVSDVLKDASEKIYPIVDKAWNEMIVKILTSKCSAPLAAVKGVAATYRMTNRPPPKQASPFVGTILRPLKEFAKEFTHRTPDRVGSKWKHQVVVTISDRYGVAVDELLTTVKRTEEALRNRNARRRSAGIMSDGEKVKLQLYLDYQTFYQAVKEVGVDPATVVGISKLKELTSEGEALQQRQQNGT